MTALSDTADAQTIRLQVGRSGPPSHLTSRNPSDPREDPIMTSISERPPVDVAAAGLHDLVKPDEAPSAERSSSTRQSTARNWTGYSPRRGCSSATSPS